MNRLGLYDHCRPLPNRPKYSILFYSILFYSILFYSILFYSILFYSIPNDTAFVLDIKQEVGGSRSSATVNCHDFTGVNSKLQRLTLSVTKLPRADRIGHHCIEIY